jgi:hypothetical protein
MITFACFSPSAGGGIMGTGASSLAVALLVLTVAAPRLAAQGKPPAPPEPPSAAAAEKPSSDALAQEAEGKPNQPEKEKKPSNPWSGHVAAGFNFTKGNSDIRTFNASLALAYDPHTRNVVKADAFYIFAYERGASTVDRTSAHLRDERELAPRWCAFADAQYIKDRFKRIDYLVTPTAGVGYRLLKSEARQLDVDAGAGAPSSSAMTRASAPAAARCARARPSPGRSRRRQC